MGVRRCRKLDGGCDMQGGNERSEEGLEQFDEQGLERIEEVFDIGELQNALVRDLP